MDSLVKCSAGCCSHSLSRGFWDVYKRFSCPLYTILTWLSGLYGSASAHGYQKPLPLSTWSFSTLTWLTQCTCMYTHAQAHRPHRHCFWPSSPFDTDSVSFRPCGEDSVDSAGGGAVILKDTERRWSELKVGTSFRFYFCHFWFEATSWEWCTQASLPSIN